MRGHFHNTTPDSTNTGTITHRTAATKPAPNAGAAYTNQAIID